MLGHKFGKNAVTQNSSLFCWEYSSEGQDGIILTSPNSHVGIKIY